MHRIFKFATMLGIAAALLSCRAFQPHANPPPFLPAHPASEMFPRASSPPPTCPGQYRSMLEGASGSYFMGCWGQKQDQQP